MLYYHLVLIFTLQYVTPLSISNFAVFLHTVFNPLNQSKFDFISPKQTCTQLVEIEFGRSFFPDIICARGEQKFWQSLTILRLATFTKHSWDSILFKNILPLIYYLDILIFHYLLKWNWRQLHYSFETFKLFKYSDSISFYRSKTDCVGHKIWSKPFIETKINFLKWLSRF